MKHLRKNQKNQKIKINKKIIIKIKSKILKKNKKNHIRHKYLYSEKN